MSNNNLKWYILKCMNNHEKVIAKRLEIENNENLTIKCVVPTEKITTIKDTKRVFKEVISYPGYVFIQTNSLGEVVTLSRQIKGTQGFIKEKNGNINPMNDKDVQKMFKIMDDSHNTDKYDIQIGDLVKILDGPFSNFKGIVAEIDNKDLKAKLHVEIFGKKTPVEMYLSALERAE